jgi:DNA-binding MarR family transcriptional regulator
VLPLHQGGMTRRPPLVCQRSDNGVVTTPEDDVDRIVSAWRRERPDLDVSPLEVLSRVTRIAKHVDNFRRDAFRTSGLESWEFDVLAALRRAGKPYRLSPKALLQETLVSSGAMTHRLTKLEARGFITRSSDPEDGRGVVVTLTPQGVSAVDTALSLLVGAEQSLLETLGPAQRKDVARALRQLNRDIPKR